MDGMNLRVIHSQISVNTEPMLVIDELGQIISFNAPAQRKTSIDLSTLLGEDVQSLAIYANQLSDNVYVWIKEGLNKMSHSEMLRVFEENNDDDIEPIIDQFPLPATQRKPESALDLEFDLERALLEDAY